jgi:hypothetical protein
MVPNEVTGVNEITGELFLKKTVTILYELHVKMGYIIGSI